MQGGGEDRSEESSTNGNESNAVSTREGHLTDKDKMNLRGLSGAMSESAGYGAQQFKRGVTHLLGADSLEGPAALKSDLEAFFKPLMKDHAKFLFNFVLTFHTNPSNAHAKEGVSSLLSPLHPNWPLCHTDRTSCLRFCPQLRFLCCSLCCPVHDDPFHPRCPIPGRTECIRDKVPSPTPSDPCASAGN